MLDGSMGDGLARGCGFNDDERGVAEDGILPLL